MPHVNPIPAGGRLGIQPHPVPTTSMKNNLIRPLVLAVVCASLGAGCANVKPWQRGTLSDMTMRGDRDPLGLTLTEHLYFSREAATGGRGVGGGGCGCN